MSEHLGPLGSGPPNYRHVALYTTWARGGWGIIITGNVQVSPVHLGLGADLVFPPLGDSYELGSWKTLAAACHASLQGKPKPIALIQLCHTGRQSPRLLGGRPLWRQPLAPSAKRVGEDVKASAFVHLLYWIIFQRPKVMMEIDIDRAVAEFVHGAKIAYEAGFDGVQVHGAHGCGLDFTDTLHACSKCSTDLVTQFLSPKV